MNDFIKSQKRQEEIFEADRAFINHEITEKEWKQITSKSRGTKK